MEDKPVVPAVNRALNILEFVAKNREPASIKEIAQNLKLPNTTVFRIVKQLSMRGYLEESESRTGYYHLGLQLLTLSHGMIYINNLRQVCHAELDRLAIDSHQAVQMGVLKGNQVTYIEQILPPNPVLIYTTPYAELPLNISAAGKVLAAFSPQNTLYQLLRQVQFKKMTPQTIDDVNEFTHYLEGVRQMGYAVDNEEFALGIGCLAAPVFNHEQRCVAAIGVTGSIQDYRGESKERLVSMLLRTADTISQKLGMPSTINYSIS